MSRPGWTEVAAGRPPGSGARSLAYVSPEGDLALWNDHEEHRTLLVRRPELSAEERAVLGNWRAGRSGPAVVSVGEQVHGYGVFTFPYGPVAMGVAEAGGFEVRTYGERILEIEPSVGHKRRGIEEQVVGKTVEDAALWIERRAGPFALSHAAAFRFAAESAAGRPVAERELGVRALGQELQRIYNHLHVLARLAEAASQNVGAAQLNALAESALRALGATFGHRWGFGALVPGAPGRRLDAPDRTDLEARLRRLGSEFEALGETLLGSRTFLDRIQSTGTVSTEDALRWGAVGPTLRASSVAWDDRLRDPTIPYREMFVPVVTERAGDALARVLVRREEVRGSLLLIEQLLDRWPRLGGGEAAPVEAIEPGRGIARGEGPSGDLVYDVRVSEGRIRSVASRTPSQANWPLVALSLRGAVFTDFAFSFESFGASFAETDG